MINRIKRFYVKAFNTESKIETVTFLGKTLHVTKRAIRQETDYDDAWFYALANNHKVIYDIGAAIGFNSLIASTKDPAKKIILIDANRLSLAYAAKNLILNDMSLNKMFIYSAITDKKGTVEFFTVGTGYAGSIFKSLASTASNKNSFETVPTTTIDRIVSETGIEPTLIKLDIEGAEILALKGATTLAANGRCKFIVEMHSSESLTMSDNAQGVIDWCKENDYSPYYLADHVLLQSARMISGRGRCHLLLIPKDEQYPTYLQNIKQGSRIK